MHSILVFVIASILTEIKSQSESDLSQIFPLGGITLSHDGNLYEITTQECPGGIFFTKPVNETCLCYNGIFSIVRECCTNNNSTITTETLEWRKNYQCGMSPEIGNSGEQSIKAVLPLTKTDSPFQPVLTFKEFSGDNFMKWRKFDLKMLSAVSTPIAFKSASEVEIVNVRPLSKVIKFKMGKYGDVDICYKGWIPEGPQSIRISIYTYSKQIRVGSCCFQIRNDNSPGIITSPCRGGSIITEIVDIVSVNSGNSCPTQGKSKKAIALAKENWINRPSKSLIRFKRSEDNIDAEANIEDMLKQFRLKRDDSSEQKDAKDVISEPQHPLDPSVITLASGGPPNPSAKTLILGDNQDDTTPPLPDPRYPLDELNRDSLEAQHSKLRAFTILRKKGVTSVIREPESQRFILLKKSLEIFIKLVPEEMIPKVMMEDGFEAFFYLYESLDQINVNDQQLTKEQFQRTLNVLGNCSINHKPWKETIEFHYKNGSCPLEVIEFDVTLENGTKQMNIPVPFPPEWLIYDKTKHDIIVEINWKLVDFVHTICFDDFFDDYNAHHFYENQMEMLFLQKYVQNRWFRSIEASDNYAKGIIGIIEKDSRMRELDKVLAMSHYLSRYKEFLHRPLQDNVDPKLANQLILYEQSVEQRLDRLQRSRIYNGDIDNHNSVNGGGNDADEEDPSVTRKKKHIGQDNTASINDLGVQKYDSDIKIAKPGDTIWNGLAVCLDAKSNDDPAYYTEEELWGTKPTLSELGKIYYGSTSKS